MRAERSNLSKCQQNKIRARRGRFLRPAIGGNSERLCLFVFAHGVADCFVAFCLRKNLLATTVFIGFGGGAADCFVLADYVGASLQRRIFSIQNSKKLYYLTFQSINHSFNQSFIIHNFFNPAPAGHHS